MGEVHMCILMIVYQLIKDVPILLAANRDEYLDRPTEGPCVLTQAPQTWGGRDKRQRRHMAGDQRQRFTNWLDKSSCKCGLCE